MNQAIEIIEDEEDISELMRYNLANEGYDVSCSYTGEQGLQRVLKNPPSLILLDLMLPGIDGIEICKRLRANQETSQIPIIMVTAKGEENDIVRGLETGADDYLVKPFSPRILSARIQSILRRGQKSVQQRVSEVELHGLYMNQGQRKARLDGEPLSLTDSEFRILFFLASRPGWVFTRGQIVKGVRGTGYAVTERVIDVQVVSLRKKLKEGLIETVRGVGYRFKEKS